MRNTVQYPITIDEMIDACERASVRLIESWKADPHKMPIGSIDAAALQEAAKRLKRLQFAAA